MIEPIEVLFRPLDAADVPRCADLHVHAFPGFFLSALGPAFLREFYAGHLADPDAVSVVATDADGNVLGVVVGSSRPSAFFRRLLFRRWYAFAMASVGLVLRRPTVVPRLARAVMYRGYSPSDMAGALLSSICVDPKMQGLSIGSRLIADWTVELVRRGKTRAYLFTDRDSNDLANAFYVRAGWKKESSFLTREGRGLNCYVWSIDDESDVNVTQEGPK